MIPFPASLPCTSSLVVPSPRILSRESPRQLSRRTAALFFLSQPFPFISHPSIDTPPQLPVAVLSSPRATAAVFIDTLPHRQRSAWPHRRSFTSPAASLPLPLPLSFLIVFLSIQSATPLCALHPFTRTCLSSILVFSCFFTFPRRSCHAVWLVAPRASLLPLSLPISTLSLSIRITSRSSLFRSRNALFAIAFRRSHHAVAQAYAAQPHHLHLPAARFFRRRLAALLFAWILVLLGSTTCQPSTKQNKNRYLSTNFFPVSALLCLIGCARSSSASGS